MWKYGKWIALGGAVLFLLWHLGVMEEKDIPGKDLLKGKKD